MRGNLETRDARETCYLALQVLAPKSREKYYQAMQCAEPCFYLHLAASNPRFTGHAYMHLTEFGLKRAIPMIDDAFTAVLAWVPPQGVRHTIEFPGTAGRAISVRLMGRSASDQVEIPQDSTADEVFRVLTSRATAVQLGSRSPMRRFQ